MSQHVDVTGTGRATGTPDVVLLEVRVQCDGPDVARALQDASRRMTALQDVAGTRGIQPADLQTTGSGVQQRWANDGSGVVGYTAWQSLRVRVRETGDAGELVTAFAKAAGDALAVDGITLGISDAAPLAREARELAFSDARDKAEQYAALAGRSLGAVRSVSDLPSGGGYPAPVARMKVMAADSAGSMPVQAGEQSVEASVAVRWSWSD